MLLSVPQNGLDFDVYTLIEPLKLGCIRYSLASATSNAVWPLIHLTGLQVLRTSDVHLRLGSTDC